MSTPNRRDRPRMPEGYGLPEDEGRLLDWEVVERRLAGSVTYWLATTRQDGRPHVIPRWGVWVDGRFWYDGSPETIHVRNLVRDPVCVLHLGDGTEAVIADGKASPAEPPEPSLAQRLSEAFRDKYAAEGYAPEADAWSGPDAGGLLVFRPDTVLAWFDFPEDATRFHFT